jgi:hypothetical protein
VVELPSDAVGVVGAVLAVAEAVQDVGLAEGVAQVVEQGEGQLVVVQGLVVPAGAVGQAEGGLQVGVRVVVAPPAGPSTGRWS